MSENSTRIICPVCGKIDRSLVEIYKMKLRKQNFAISPILPTCKQCASEIEIYNPPKGAELIVLNGTCGSGKSTIAEELMRRNGYSVIDGDCMLQVLRHRLGNKVDYNSEKALEEIGREIDILAALGYMIVLSHIILPEDWGRYKAIFSKRGLKYRHFLLKPDIDTVISRCNTRTCHKSVTPEYWIRYFDERLIFNENDGVVIIDNTDLSIDETVMRVIETSESEKHTRPANYIDL